MKLSTLAKGGDAVAPLLPEFRPVAASDGDGGREASVPGAVFNLATTIIGAGIMSLPAAVRVLGVVPALLLVVAAAFLADASAEFLLRYSGSGGAAPFSYAATMEEAFGRAGSSALHVCVGLTTAGALTVYLVIIGKETVSQTFPLPVRGVSPACITFRPRGRDADGVRVFSCGGPRGRSVWESIGWGGPHGGAAGVVRGAVVERPRGSAALHRRLHHPPAGPPQARR
ncbi:hypothetical protein B296_00011490 [Ensete ventricosum]|uniref:Amino acid transporter transmembrane domain-containing protein n=1 Tax=Ensete ventricosum TaxID=4639 RepID=A0A427AFH6_ENSVE|nr:hypothetical protein B296_00011490 [Ensete ventricosum]